MEILNQLKPAIIQKELEDIYAELYPYYTNSEIISNSEFNEYKDTSIETLKSDIKLLYQQMLNTRTVYLTR
jgi:hypothetical protein